VLALADNNLSKNRTLVFITTSLGTKWESYSQALIARGYPNQTRIIVDGTQKWSALMFLDRALEQDSDYTIHIDEDCFLYEPKQLDNLICYLEANDDVVFAGIPDGGHYYRVHNPCACNLFFVVFKTEAVRRILASNPDWKSLQFKDSYRVRAGLENVVLDRSRIAYDDYEPYYPFFWSILESGKRINYLDNRLDSDLFSTDVYFNGAKRPMARHMWYLRSWEMKDCGPYDKLPNLERYRRLENEIKLLFGHDLSFRKLLLRQNVERLIRRTQRKLARRFDAVSQILARLRTHNAKAG